MNTLVASPLEVDSAYWSVREFVEGHDSKPYSNSFGSFLVYQAELSAPRPIGDFEAHFLRLFKGLRSNIIAGASYSQLGLEPDPITDIAREMPLRHIMIREFGAATYSFNRTMDAREYPLTQSMAEELVVDVANAH